MTTRNPPISRRYALVSAITLLFAFVLLLSLAEGPHPGSMSMPALPSADIDARKAGFFAFLRPIVRHHNARIRAERAWLETLDPEEPPAWFRRHRFESLAAQYGVDLQALDYPDALSLLQRRVDIIPEALVLVQAAKESGWGRSRFAQEGNALFGEWCFNRGCGIVPAGRAAGRGHEVRSFRSVHDAVGSYMNNLNSHRSYRDLRIAREKMRAENKRLSALQLAEQLSSYSERGEAYVQEVKAMILQNDLEPG